LFFFFKAFRFASGFPVSHFVGTGRVSSECSGGRRGMKLRSYTSISSSHVFMA
jgi:hypothetical protein